MRLSIRLSSALLTMLPVGALLSGCGGSSGTTSPTSSTSPTASGGATGQKITVAMLPKKKGLSYFTSCAKGAEEAAREAGDVALIYDGPTDGSPEKAASLIEQWTLKNVDVIAIAQRSGRAGAGHESGA